MSKNKNTKHKNKDKAGADQNSVLLVASKSPDRPSVFSPIWRELCEEEGGGGESLTPRWAAIS